MFLRQWKDLAWQCVSRRRPRAGRTHSLLRRRPDGWGWRTGWAITAEVCESRILLSAYNFKVMADTGSNAALKAYDSLTPIGIDAAGDVAFTAFNANAPPGPVEDIFFASGIGGQPKLITGGSVGVQFDTAAMNSKGTIAYFQDTLAYGGSPSDGIYAVSKDGTSTRLVQTNPASFVNYGNPISFSLFGNAMSLADDNTIAFSGDGRYVIGGVGNSVFVQQPGKPLTQIGPAGGYPRTSINAHDQIAYLDYQGDLVLVDARIGSSAVIVPASPKTSAYQYGAPAINDSGTVAYVAPNGLGGDGIYTYDTSTAGNPRLIVDTTSGPFSALGAYNRQVTISNAGTVAFVATLKDGSTGIFAGQDPVNDRVVATGDTLFGARVDNLSFISNINAQNQLVFAAHLAAGAASRWIIVRANVDSPDASIIKSGQKVSTIQLPLIMIPQLQGGGSPWAGLEYANHDGLIGGQAGKGCALTVLSMALNYAGVTELPISNVPTVPAVLNQYLRPDGKYAVNPGTLNKFMQDDGDYTSGGATPAENNNVKWGDTVQHAANAFVGLPKTAVNILRYSTLTVAYPGDGRTAKSLPGIWHGDYVTDPGGMQAAFGELDEILAREHAPVVVAVKLTPTAFDSESGKATSVKIGHFVLVTGKMANGDYSILDPAGKYSTLGGYKNYLGNDTWFQLNGYIKDPPGTSDLRAWASAPGEGVSVTLIDPQGRTTGFDPTTGMEFQEIPGSAQYFVAIADAVTGATADGLTHFIDALEPMAGMYTIVIRSNGVADVPYTISLGGDAIDGTEHNPLQIDGMARSGIADTFKIVLDPASFAQPTVVVPVLDPIPNVTVTQGTPVTFTAVAHDADPSAVLTFSLGAGAPAGASIDPSTGLFTWMPVDAPVVANILVIVSVNGTPVQNIGQYVKITVKSAIPVFTVTNTADSGAGSLRQAILNANIDPGPDTILFNIGPGTQTIVLQSPLPAITDQVFIDGESEPGFSEHPLIVLDGSSAGFGVDGLVLGSGSDGSKIRGIVVDRFKSAGLRIQSSHNTIQGDYFGVDATGETAAGNFYGLILASTASNNLIGAGADGNAGEGNVLSGNGQAGVALIGHGVTQNAISANHIGTDAGGSIAIRNGSYGVYIDGSSNNTVGGTTAGLGNVISGNGSFGIYMWDNATGNAVQGNYIGTDSTGTAALGNGFAGIYILSANNVIGGNQLGAGNVISANPYGLLLWEAAATGNLVAGNLIGTDCSGRKPLGNTFAGLYVYNADKNVIGGTTAAARNIISGNNGVGIVTAGTSAQNVFEGDYVGLDVKGDTPIPNLNIGVLIESPNNTIGGIAAGAGNVISGNGGVGLWIYGAGGGMGTTITGNYIGTDATGSKARGNAYQGIYIGASANNSIRSNVISGNGNNGIWIDGMAATGNVVQGNLIGVDVGGVAAIGNSFSGIVITAGSNNRIGGASPGDGNVIAANGNWGVWIDGSSASGNAVAGNHIGVLADGSTLMGNTFDGVALSRGASGNLIGGGTASAGNAIAGNFRDGVRVLDQSSSNTIRANSIFSNGGLGIDLNGDGVTPNDNEDGDTGANGLQNFPVIVAADPGIATQVMGSLNSTPNSVFTLDFYANAIPDSSGYGQGKRWIGSSTVTTDAAGKADFDLTFASATVPGEWITATATSADGSTSEFSRAALVTNPLSVKAGGDQAVNEGGLVSLSSASYTSISPPIQLGLQVDWGDGTVETGSLVPGTGEGTIANTHRYAEPGNYTVTLTLTDGVNPTVTDHLHVAVADAPTQLVSYVIQHDQTQRSFIRYLDLYFSDDDGLAGFLTGQGIQLVRYDANGLNPATVSLAGLVTVSGTHVSIDFGINGIGGNRLTNAGDGTYRLILSLHEQQSTTTVQFARLLGDVNGDGSVDAADYSLALGYVKTGDPNGDINGDGFIDMRDLMVIKLAQGRKIKPPA